jgi:septum site-determining protein MinD
LLKVEVLGSIPNDRSVAKAAAFKVPVVLREPGSPAAKRINAIARKLAKVEVLEEGEEKEKKKYEFVERILEVLRIKTKSWIH